MKLITKWGMIICYLQFSILSSLTIFNEYILQVIKDKYYFNRTYEKLTISLNDVFIDEYILVLT